MQRLLVLLLCLFVTACGGGGGDSSSSASTSYAGNYIYNSSSSTMTVSIASNDNINYTGKVQLNLYGIGINISADISGKLPQTVPAAGHTVSFTPTITNIITTGKTMYNNKFYISFKSLEVPYNPNEPFNLYSGLQMYFTAEGASFYSAPYWTTLTKQ